MIGYVALIRRSALLTMIGGANFCGMRVFMGQKTHANMLERVWPGPWRFRCDLAWTYFKLI